MNKYALIVFLFSLFTATIICWFTNSPWGLLALMASHVGYLGGKCFGYAEATAMSEAFKKSTEYWKDK